MKQDYEKMKIALRAKLAGMGFTKAVEAMNFAEQLHNGKRKDGQHEFSHQVSQACLALTLLHHVDYPEELIITIFLHDVCEDKNISYEEIEAKFGEVVMAAVQFMTKVYRGNKIDNKHYYSMMASCPIASLAKGFDRVHNLMTMNGGFSPEKQVSYIEETLEYTVPMLKRARRSFPSQELAYENIKFIFTNQVQLYNALNKELIS